MTKENPEIITVVLIIALFVSLKFVWDLNRIFRSKSFEKNEVEK